MTKNTRRILGTLVALLMAMSWADAAFSKVGTTGASFLKIAVGRATAMGEAFVAIADDASASYFNPAGLAYVGRSVQFNHVEWFGGIRHDYLTAALPVGAFGTVAFSVTALTMGDMEQTTVDNPGTPVREDHGTGQIFGASDFAFAASYARAITDKLCFGLTVKAVNQNIWDMSASAVGADLGLYYNTGFRSLRIGAAVQNYGTQLSFSGRQLDYNHEWSDSGPANLPGSYRTNPVPLPAMFRFGIAYDIIEATAADPSKLTGAVELVHPSDINETVNFGLEYGVRDVFFLRGGYVFNTDREYAKSIGHLTGLTAGIGVKAAPVSGLSLGLDYTMRYFEHLKPTHRLLLTVGF